MLKINIIFYIIHTNLKYRLITMHECSLNSLLNNNKINVNIICIYLIRVTITSLRGTISKII